MYSPKLTSIIFFASSGLFLLSGTLNLLFLGGGILGYLWMGLAFLFLSFGLSERRKYKPDSGRRWFRKR